MNEGEGEARVRGLRADGDGKVGGPNERRMGKERWTRTQITLHWTLGGSHSSRHSRGCGLGTCCTASQPGRRRERQWVGAAAKPSAKETSSPALSSRWGEGATARRASLTISLRRLPSFQLPQAVAAHTASKEERVKKKKTGTEAPADWR